MPNWIPDDSRDTWWSRLSWSSLACSAIAFAVAFLLAQYFLAERVTYFERPNNDERGLYLFVAPLSGLGAWLFVRWLIPERDEWLLAAGAVLFILCTLVPWAAIVIAELSQRPVWLP